MKTRISPGDSGLFLGFIGFLISVPVVIFAYATMGPGRTVSLNGFFSFTFTGGYSNGLLLLHPIANTIAGVVEGILIAWVYNFYARIFGGISIDLKERDSTDA